MNHTKKNDDDHARELAAQLRVPPNFPAVAPGLREDQHPNSPSWDYMKPEQRHLFDVHENRRKHGGWHVTCVSDHDCPLTLEDRRAGYVWSATRPHKIAGVVMPETIKAASRSSLMHVLLTIQECEQ